MHVALGACGPNAFQYPDAFQYLSSYSGFAYVLVGRAGLSGLLLLGSDSRPRPCLQTTPTMTSVAKARIARPRIHAGMPATFVPNPVAAASGAMEGAIVGAAVGVAVGDADGAAVGVEVGDEVG